MSDGRWSAVVLTSARDSRDVVAIAAKQSHRWKLSVAGISMLSRVVALLQRMEFKSPIVVSAETEIDVQETLLRDFRAVKVVGIAANPAASALAAAQFLKHFPLLILTAEKALLNVKMVEQFQLQAMASGADFVVGLVDAEKLSASFPDIEHQTVKVGADHFGFANVFAVMTAKGLHMLNRWSAAEDDSSNAKQLAAIFGLGRTFGWLFSKQSLEKALARLSGDLGIVVRAVFMPSAEAGVSLRSPAAIALAARILAQRQGQS